MDIINKIQHSTILKRKPIETRNFNKVFCVGWLKTGTTSMKKAFKLLGLKHLGYDQHILRNWYRKNKIQKIINYAQYYESFDDLPWNKPELFPNLDKAFPNSKYVLTLRDPEDWLNSYIRWTKKQGVIMKYDREELINGYLQHNDFYKQNINSDNLLVFNIFKGDSIIDLAEFLNIKTDIDPTKPFPHENKT